MLASVKHGSKRVSFFLRDCVISFFNDLVHIIGQDKPNIKLGKEL